MILTVKFWLKLCILKTFICSLLNTNKVLFLNSEGTLFINLFDCNQGKRQYIKIGRDY